jgi:predicted transcriptional regulator
MPQSVLEIAKDLTLALVETGSLSAGDMQDTLQKTFATLAALKAQEETGASTAAIPEVVDWRKSITRHTITCLECGQTLKQLSVRHLKQHDLDGQSYRAKYGIPTTQPLAARETLAKQRQIAAKIRPWESTPTYIKAQAKKAVATKESGRKRPQARSAKPRIYEPLTRPEIPQATTLTTR